MIYETIMAIAQSIQPIFQIAKAIIRLISEKKQRGHVTLGGIASFAIAIIIYVSPHISSYLTT